MKTIRFLKLNSKGTKKQKIYDEEYEEAKNKAEEEYRKEAEAAKAEYLEKIQKTNAEIAEWKKKAELRANSAYTQNAPVTVLKDMLDSDIAKAEDLLKRTYQACNDLY